MLGWLASMCWCKHSMACFPPTVTKATRPSTAHMFVQGLHQQVTGQLCLVWCWCRCNIICWQLLALHQQGRAGV